MSASGPAVVVTRIDEKPISEAERSDLLGTVASAAKNMRLLDHEDEPVTPRVHEPESSTTQLAILLFSSYVYDAMPDEVREDEDATWTEHGATLAAPIHAKSPDVYRIDCYYVED